MPDTFMKQKNKKLLLIVSLLALLGVIFIILYSHFMSGSASSSPGHGLCPKMIPPYMLWISIILVIVAVVPISYYFISKKLEEKMEKNLAAISRMVDSNLQHNKEKEQNNGSILKLMNNGERKVIQKMIDNDGSVLQSEIARMEGMTKLKAHRIVKELESKGIVRLESYGKTKRLTLVEDMKEILLKE